MSQDIIITIITTTTITHTHSDPTSIQRHKNQYNQGRLIIIRTIQIKERQAVEETPAGE